VCLALLLVLTTAAAILLAGSGCLNLLQLAYLIRIGNVGDASPPGVCLAGEMGIGLGAFCCKLAN